MVPEITFMRILIYGSTCVCVCVRVCVCACVRVWASRKCNANIDKYMQRHLLSSFWVILSRWTKQETGFWGWCSNCLRSEWYWVWILAGEIKFLCVRPFEASVEPTYPGTELVLEFVRGGEADGVWDYPLASTESCAAGVAMWDLDVPTDNVTMCNERRTKKCW